MIDKQQAEAMIRDAYRAGDYACAYDEGMIWKKRDTDPTPEPPETEDEVVARLLGKAGSQS